MRLQTLFLFNLSALLLLIMSFTFYFNFKNAQAFIENQVYSNSQNTAYSLGLALASIDDESMIEQELRINAIFDSGYYEYIRLYDINNTLVYEATLPMVIKDVPQWFIDVVPISLHEAQSEVNSGWSKFGSLHVKGHRGYAYYELYQHFKEYLWLFSLISFIAFVGLMFIVNRLLYTLTLIMQQADAIRENRFVMLKKSALAIEFQSLISTMNKMVKKVEKIFNSEVKLFQTYQEILYKDEDSGLANKKYLVLKLKELLSNEEVDILNRELAIISIDGLDKIKKEEGYFRYKEIFDVIKTRILEEIDNKHLLVRISQNELAILFEDDTDNLVEKTLKKLNKVFSSLASELQVEPGELCFHTGITPFIEDDTVSELLSRADYSLQQTKMRGCQLFNTLDEEDMNPLISQGKEAWHKKFDDIFEHNRITFATQKVYKRSKDRSFHNETLLRIIDSEGNVNTAGFYLPMALSMNLISKIDTIIIHLVLARLEENSTPTAINISRDFITSTVMYQELSKKLLALDKKYHNILHFELRESDIVQNLDAYINFSDTIHAASQVIGIDNFSGLENIEYIKKVRPKYIKITYNTLHDAHTNNEAILHTLVVLTQIMDIKLIITSIQTKEEYERLVEWGYNYFQGNYIEAPTL